MPDPMPDEDAGPPADAFEAELVAYLDGELDPAAARRVEARLAADPQARARAAALKKTFDLLDYLPRPDPSGSFTSRTLEKLPALQAPAQPAAAPAATASQPRPPRTSQSILAASVSRPVPPALPAPLSSPSPRNWNRIAWAAGLILALGTFATAGYYTGKTFRKSPGSPQDQIAAANPNTTLETHASTDRHLFERLPLYTAVDNFKYANDLAEVFSDAPVLAIDPAIKLPSAPRETPAAVLAAQEQAFKKLPPDRQKSIRTLDEQIEALPAAERDRLLQVLELHAAWLQALSPADARAVLEAPAADLRLRKVREIRDRQWLDQLSPGQRRELVGASDTLKQKRIRDWKDEEARVRKEWSAARRHPSDSLDMSKPPLLFETDSRRAEIVAFARSAFRLDDPAKSRLNANDLDRYLTAYNFANSQGGAAWYIYGRTLYELLKRPDPLTGKPVEELLLPPPADPKLKYTQLDELPLVFKGNQVKNRLSRISPAYTGKWPEYALEVHKDVHQMHKDFKGKGEFAKGGAYNFPELGPSRPSEFTDDVRKFVEKELKLNPGEEEGLRKLQGKWPDYPRELIRLAHDHDLSVPGVMLPGSPRQWDAIYGTKK